MAFSEDVGMAANAPEGMIVRNSPHEARATFDRLRRFVDAHGLKVFAHIEHDTAAAAAGMVLPFTQVLVSGNPRAGTPMMQRTPTIAIDLPLRVAVWEDADGAAWLGYDDPLWIGARHRMPGGSTAPFQTMHDLLGAASDAAAGPVT